MVGNTSLSPQQQELLLQRVGSVLLESVPSDWEEIVFTFGTTVEISSALLEVTKSDGTTITLPSPGQAMSLLDELRDGMYATDKGAWFNARYVVTRPGNYRAQYDYENEPKFKFTLDPRTYANDLQQYPRSEENIPDWLRRKLEEAQQ